MQNSLPPNSLARVLLDRALDRYFDYLIPAELQGKVEVGDRVIIPLRNQGEQRGYVIELPKETDCPHHKLKPMSSIDSKLIPPSLIKLAAWISAYYCAPYAVTLRAFLPAPVRKDNIKQKVEILVQFAEGIDPLAQIAAVEDKHPKRAAILRALLKMKAATPSKLIKAAGVSTSPLQTLMKQNVLVKKENIVERDPFAKMNFVKSNPLKLNDEQKVCLDSIVKDVEAKNGATSLLYGITGSGKTEVYLQAIQRVLELGLEAIVLVPEISLTPQTVQRFRSRFGDRVSVLHSNLSEGERFEQWNKIHQGETSIVVGARSALFAPFRKLGLIVVDEEHESSYKQDTQPRYHARDVAVYRAFQEKCACVLGTATPSFETYRNALKERYRMLKLTNRAETNELPHIHIVDMRLEAAHTGQAQIISRQLENAIRKRLEDHMQVILFLNRRGYSTSFACSCGYKAECEHCDIALTFHKRSEALSCHLCGRVHKAPSCCPHCGKTELLTSGLGTQKLENLCRGMFKDARTVRMDSDTMTRKDSHQTTLDDFQAGKYDILIGTQMIAKGLHFPKVTLVGIVFADASLNMQDFRAPERTFQLVTQVAGRSGRAAHKGEVIIQAYSPDHPALQCSLKGDYNAFYHHEFPGREICKFPPVRQMAIVYFSGKIEPQVHRAADFLQQQLEGENVPGCNVMPAVPCAIPRVDERFRYQVTIFADKLPVLSRTLGPLLKSLKLAKGITCSADMDPQSFH